MLKDKLDKLVRDHGDILLMIAEDPQIIFAEGVLVLLGDPLIVPLNKLADNLSHVRGIMAEYSRLDFDAIRSKEEISDDKSFELKSLGAMDV